MKGNTSSLWRLDLYPFGFLCISSGLKAASPANSVFTIEGKRPYPRVGIGTKGKRDACDQGGKRPPPNPIGSSPSTASDGPISQGKPDSGRRPLHSHRPSVCKSNRFVLCQSMEAVIHQTTFFCPSRSPPPNTTADQNRTGSLSEGSSFSNRTPQPTPEQSSTALYDWGPQPLTWWQGNRPRTKPEQQHPTGSTNSSSQHPREHHQAYDRHWRT